MNRFVIVSCAALVGCVASASQAQQTAYAIANGGGTLVRFQTNNPSAVTVVGAFSGAAAFLDGLAFRPATGQLYGYLDATDSFYTVNPQTGALTLASAGASGSPTNTFNLGINFNPTIDRARVVTDSGQNIVFNPDAGTVTGATAVFYPAGDANAANPPSVIANAYTNHRPGAATTTQYVIDYANDVLATLANNAGTLTTVGPLGVNTDIYSGLDIFTSAQGVDTAYAILQGPTGGTPALYTINLGTGAASLVGNLGVAAAGLNTQVYGLAIVPIPAPAAGVFALVGAAAAARRRR